MSERDKPELKSYDAVVFHYLAEYAADADREAEWFRRPKTVGEAIDRACGSHIPSGRGGKQIRHPHQRRMSVAALAAASRVLQSQQSVVITSPDFRSLHRLVESAISPIAGLGELTIYDIAHRIGAHLGPTPTEIYLHAGTRKGAKALGLDTSRKSIPMTELPAPLQRLTAAQAEDVLCIYHKVLARLRPMMPQPTRWSARRQKSGG